MHVPNVVKIPWYLLKLSSGNENMGVSRTDNSVKIGRNLSISNPKPDLHNINAHTKFGEKSIDVYSSYHPETRYGRTDECTTDGRTDRCVQLETIIPRHYMYHVAGNKNKNFTMKKSCSFHISVQNIDCGYLLKPLRWGGSKKYPQSRFCAEIRK